MAWVRTVPPAEAEGEVLEAYQAITGERRPQRTGKVVSSTSLRPQTMVAMMELNHAAHFVNEGSGLTRLQREMIATVTSVTLECRY
jgi:hypothetical protein